MIELCGSPSLFDLISSHLFVDVSLDHRERVVQLLVLDQLVNFRFQRLFVDQICKPVLALNLYKEVGE